MATKVIVDLETAQIVKAWPHQRNVRGHIYDAAVDFGRERMVPSPSIERAVYWKNNPTVQEVWTVKDMGGGQNNSSAVPVHRNTGGHIEMFLKQAENESYRKPAGMALQGIQIYVGSGLDLHCRTG